MSPTPGSSLARVQKKTHLAAGADAGDLDFAEMLARARVLAETDLVPKALRKKPNAIVLVGAMGAELGVPFATSLKQIDVIEGKAEPCAQLQIGLVRRAGHELRWGVTSDERAVIRGRRREYRDDPNGWTEVEWTIEQARRAGLLDRWVERNVADGKWPDGNTKWKTERIAVGDDRGLFIADDRMARGLPKELPEWATKALESGEVKAKDNWQRYPADMLRARAAKAIVRMEFSDVLAGLGFDPTFDFDSDLDVDAERVGHEDDPPVGRDTDDDITDADIIEDACPLPGCTVEGPHDHDSWVERQPAETPPAEPEAKTTETPADPERDAKTWNGDKWREVLTAVGVKQVAALKEARRLAEEAGVALPAALDELEGTDVAAALAQRLEALR